MERMTLSSNDDWRSPVVDEFSSTQLMDLVVIAVAFSFLSALGSIFIIVTFWRFPRLQTFAYKIIMMLAVANFCLDCAYLVGSVGHNNWKCTLQGWARVYFSLVEFGLITAITLTCYLITVRHQFRIQEHFMSVMAYCWLVPLVMSLLPFTTDNYGGAGAWCSITSKDLKSLEWGTFWRFAIIYVPLWVAVLLNGYLCLRVYRAVKGFEASMAAYDEDGDDDRTEAEGPLPPTGDGEATGANEEKTARQERGSRDRDSSGSSSMTSDESRRGRDGGAVGTTRAAQYGGQRRPRRRASASTAIVSRLRLYPIALVICWSWATVNRVHEAIYPYSPIFWLYVLQYSFQTIHGFLNLIIFLRTPGVKDKWRDDMKDCKSPWCTKRRVTDVDRAALLRGPRSDHK